MVKSSVQARERERPDIVKLPMEKVIECTTAEMKDY